MFLEQCYCKLICFSGSVRQIVKTFTDCHVYYTLAIGRYWLLLATVPTSIVMNEKLVALICHLAFSVTAVINKGSRQRQMNLI